MNFKPCITYSPGDKTYKEWIDFAVDNGFRCMEIAVGIMPQEPKKQDEIINYAKEKGLSLSLHSYFGPNNIADTDIENRKKSVKEAKYSIDLAKKHNLETVTFHPGRLSKEDESVLEKWEVLMDSVREIAEYAKEQKVKVGIENMEKRPYEFVFTIDDLNRFAEFGADNPYFGVTIDFAHFSSLGITAPDLKKLKLPVYNVHLSQGVPGKMHFPLTIENGLVNVESVVKVLNDYGYDGRVVFETGEPYVESRDIFVDVANK